MDRQCPKNYPAQIREGQTLKEARKPERPCTPHGAYECVCYDVEGDNRDACEKVLKIVRSLQDILRILDAAGGVIDYDALKRFRRFIETERRDLKKEDAIEALKRIRDINAVTE